MLFRAAETPHVRCHAPKGYQDYRSYKPWLRDEFPFRCVCGPWPAGWRSGSLGGQARRLAVQQLQDCAIVEWGGHIR